MGRLKSRAPAAAIVAVERRSGGDDWYREPVLRLEAAERTDDACRNHYTEEFWPLDDLGINIARPKNLKLASKQECRGLIDKPKNVEICSI